MIFYDLFVFFYFINEKIYYYKIFFHYKCSYKLSTIIQKILKIIQKLSIRSQKNQKNPKKSRKIPIFSLFSYALNRIFAKSRQTIYRKKSRKKTSKKKSKKKWFSFLQTFFLKSILDIFLCPISKLKKKF